jgi:hypothetical protein
MDRQKQAAHLGTGPWHKVLSADLPAFPSRCRTAAFPSVKCTLPMEEVAGSLKVNHSRNNGAQTLIFLEKHNFQNEADRYSCAGNAPWESGSRALPSAINSVLVWSWESHFPAAGSEAGKGDHEVPVEKHRAWWQDTWNCILAPSPLMGTWANY